MPRKPQPSEVVLSRKLGRVLRRTGGRGNGLQISGDGYADLTSVLSQPQFSEVSVHEIENLVEDCPKRRFSIIYRKGKALIRANQGHSIVHVNDNAVEMKHLPVVPVHGTCLKRLPAVMLQGLLMMQRNRVHMAKGLSGQSGAFLG